MCGSFHNFFYILAYKIVYLESLGREHTVQHSQRRNAVANSNLCKSYESYFYASSHRFREIKV